MSWSVIIPVKHSGMGKSRLDLPRRDVLARAFAADTIRAALAATRVARVIVVTDDDLVAQDAHEAGAEVMAGPGEPGIDLAVAHAATSLGSAHRRAALLGDLPALSPNELDLALARAEGAPRSYVTDAQGEGTTLLTAEAGTPWVSAFGEGSAERHATLGATLIDLPASSGLRRDVDVATDLEALAGRTGRATASVRGEPDVDLRLVVVDLDGTLLDGEHRVPEALWDLLPALRERGIDFVPASGRQLATLQHTFEESPIPLDFIAENGACVLRGGVEVSSDTLARDFIVSTVTRIRDLAASGLRAHVVLCGKRSAYIDDASHPFAHETARYYAKLQVVDDILAVEDDVFKLAVFDDDGSEAHTAVALADLTATHQVVIAGHHWADIMNAGVDKGKAVRALQQSLEITAAQTAVFGDFRNDLGMLVEGYWSYAMENAHPDAAAAARFRAPSNVDGGVLTVIDALLRRQA